MTRISFMSVLVVRGDCSMPVNSAHFPDGFKSAPKDSLSTSACSPLMFYGSIHAVNHVPVTYVLFVKQCPGIIR